MKTNIVAWKEVLHGSDTDLLTDRPSCSFKGTVHYSYDYDNKFISPPILSNLVLYISKRLENVVCLGYVARGFLDR